MISLETAGIRHAKEWGEDMPNLLKIDRHASLVLREEVGESPISFDLTPEGERFLTSVLNLRDGNEVRPGDLALLVDRGWAVRTREPIAPAPLAPVPTPLADEPGRPKPPSRRPDPVRSNASRRTRGREVALQILYQMEQNAGIDPRQVDLFIARRLRDEKLQAFARGLISGVLEHKERLDELISGVAENWRIDRMAAIDRNILRLGAYEMLYCPDVPTKVAINEALELAKRYSTAQSSRFVNGILDRLQGSGTEPAPPIAPPEDTPPGATPAEPTEP